ncbi:MAG: hypothetical protein KTR26_14040 [Flammeovirgaceae bacterium]|nr:hypothetical protein [Flammeovirgaceae bacterium]
MLCYISPMFFFPEVIFTNIHFGFTLVGQYIVKNIIIISGGSVLIATISD